MHRAPAVEEALYSREIDRNLCRFGKRDKGLVSDWPAMSTIVKVEQRLRERREIAPARTAGVLYRHTDDNAFLKDLDRELRQALYTGEGATKTSFRIQDDPAGGGLKWVVLEDARFADLASSTYTVGNAISSNGGADRLLAAVFLFSFTHGVRDGDTRALLRSYLMYRYGRRGFYPFVPTGDKEGDRDRPSEIQLSKALDREGLAVDRELESWRGIWPMPF